MVKEASSSVLDAEHLRLNEDGGQLSKTISSCSSNSIVALLAKALNYFRRAISGGKSRCSFGQSSQSQ